MKKSLLGVLALIVVTATASAIGGCSDGSRTAREGNSSKNPSRQSKDGPSELGVFIIEVTSTESNRASVAYFVPTSDSMEQSQDNNAKLPYEKRWDNVDQIPFGWKMTAQQLGGGKVTCKATYEGHVVAKNSSTGRYSIASCAPPP